MILGIQGQDAYYLTKLLIKKNYVVHGLRRRKSLTSKDSIIELKKLYKKKFILHQGDITNFFSINKIINNIKPDEIYNLAAQSHVGLSFKKPKKTREVNYTGVLNILNSIYKQKKIIKFYQASSSEFLFIKNDYKKNSPYSISKLQAFNLTKKFVSEKNLFCSNGILFNHESPKRNEKFVTRKITKNIAKIAEGKRSVIFLGNIDIYKDWGHAEDYVKTMWQMLQLKRPMDLVICTGKTYSIRYFIEKCFKYIGYRIFWAGKGLKEIGYIYKNKKKITVIKIKKKYFRPTDRKFLKGKSNQAKKILKFKPKKNINHIIKEMIDHDRKLINKKNYL